MSRPTSQADLARYRQLRIRTFALTWVAYASFYLCRKNFSVVKNTISEEYGFSNWQLGAIDTGYLVAYAAGQFIHGVLGDKIGSRLLVGSGLIVTAILNMFFSAGQEFLLFLVPWTLNGLAQATGWPGCCKVFGLWFARRERGTVMGFWVTCYQVGSLVATVLATFLLVSFAWEWAFLGPALLVAGVGLLFLRLLPDTPEREGLPHVESVYGDPQPADASGATKEAPPGSSWDNVRVILRCMPIWILGMNYFIIKFVRYSLLFWLPLYLAQHMGYGEGEAGYTSVALEVGGFGGSVVAGLVSDRYFGSRRAPIVVIMMALLALVTFAYSMLGVTGRIETILFIATIGFLLYGPDSITSGVAAVDFGDEKAAALATGFVNGLGSIGAALSGILVGFLSDAFGWDSVFLLFGPLSLAGALLMLTLWNRRPESSGV